METIQEARGQVVLFEHLILPLTIMSGLPHVVICLKVKPLLRRFVGKDSGQQEGDFLGDRSFARYDVGKCLNRNA